MTRIRSRWTVVGLAICVLAAVLMVADVLGVGWGSALGMVGVGLIAGGAATSD